MGTNRKVVGIIVLLLLPCFFAVSINTVKANDTNLVTNGDFLTGDLSNWTLEYAAAGGAESLDYKPTVSSDGYNGSNMVHSAYYNYGYCTFRIVQKLPEVSSTSRNASCWTSWSFGGYLSVNYTDGSFDMVDIPERLSMASWIQVVLPLSPGKTLDCIIIHGCGSGGHNGGLTVSNIQVLAPSPNVHPSNIQLSQSWRHERFFLPSSFSGILSSLLIKYVF